jgi:hypothetical protein
MVVLAVFAAFAVDVGYMCVVNAEARNASDAAALAAAWEIVGEERLRGNLSQVYDNARTKAVRYAALNGVATRSPVLDRNQAGALDGDIVIGRLNDPTNRSESLSFSDPSRYNSVFVRVRCADAVKDDVLFARVMGFDRFDTVAESAAAFDDRDRTPRDAESPNCSLLPFCVCLADWRAFAPATGRREWSYNPGNGDFCRDRRHLEMTMFPAAEAGRGGQGAATPPGTGGRWTSVMAEAAPRIWCPVSQSQRRRRLRWEENCGWTPAAWPA